MTKGKLGPENSIEDVKVRIQKSYKNPNVGTITQAVLKEGPQAFKIATMMEIVDPKTRSFHHYSLKIDHIDKRKGEWFHKPEKSVRLDGKEPNEVERLYTFLHAKLEGGLETAIGDVHIIKASEYAKLENILEAIPDIADADKLNLVGSILANFDAESASIPEFIKALSESSSKTINHLAAASKIIEYGKAIEVLKSLVYSDSIESEFQSHLEKNPWMFGSEYSELLPRRNWTRDDKLDYMLRKTVDDYLEIVEIKTAFSEPLFLHDKSHDSYYPSSKLSPIVGQVTRYIEEVERNRNTIIAVDGTDPLKIRARIIAGRSGDQKHQAALRNFNAHLHRIEIITYDQLIKIAGRVLSMFNVESTQQSSESDDMPF